jgi:WD40 repeat protein
MHFKYNAYYEFIIIITFRLVYYTSTHNYYTLYNFSDNVYGIDFSPNGKYLLSTGCDRTIFMWSTK